MEAMINALYDRGYYRLMQLRDLQGKVLIDRTATLRIEGYYLVHPPAAAANTAGRGDDHARLAAERHHHRREPSRLCL